MFRKTRFKIVAVTMGVLVMLFAATLAAIVFSEYCDSERQRSQMLDRYVELYSLDRPPGDGAMPPPVPPDMADSEDGPSYRLSAFYSVAFSGQGDVLAVDTGWSRLYGEQELIAVADEVLASGDDSGRRGTLVFKVEHRDSYTLVAFMDATVADEGLLSLTRHTLVVGAIVLVVLFFFFVAVSHRIVAPLEVSDARQKRFISDAGHELKTPVSIIAANADLLARQVGPNEWLDNIRHENERMGSLVAQLLDLSRAENARALREEVDLSRLVAGEALPFEGVAFERGLAIESEIADGIAVNGNRLQLAQLVSILLDNAIRHSEDGQTVRLCLRRQGRYAALVVENSGRAMTPEQLERLFERFYRVDEARAGDGACYGLGLSIAKAIVDAHGGDISVSCRDGLVIFTVLLPLQTVRRFQSSFNNLPA